MVRVSNENMPMKILLFALVLLTFQSASADTLSGRVVGVNDGDTLTVLDQKHEQHKVRLSGIDAPEKSQPFPFSLCIPAIVIADSVISLKFFSTNLIFNL